MARYANDFNGHAEGTTITVANSGAGGTPFTQVEGLGARTALAAAAFQGARGMRTTSAVEQSGFRHEFTTPTATAACRIYWRTSQIPVEADTHLLAFRTSSDSRLAVVHLSGWEGGKLRLSGVTGGDVWWDSVALSANTWYGLDLALNQNTGGVVAAVYQATNSTPLDSFSATGKSMGTVGTIGRVAFGKISNGQDGITYDFDEFAWDTGQSTLIGPFTQRLPTPAVVLGATTHPSTPGGSNGSQVVTWASVPGASGYSAHLATGTQAPEQADFVQVAESVTSPYTFTGLAAGSYAFGIKAKA